MEIYRYYYGAAAGKGIGVRAQSKALENLPLSSFLKELSSLHALESAEHKGEKLCYLLEKDGYSILGLSYLESPKESGYNRTAPCGLQYVIQTDVWKNCVQNIGSDIRTTAFTKPEISMPEPMTQFPKNQSLSSSKTNPMVLAPVVDALAKVALSQKNEILLIVLPKGIENEDETARQTIGEAMDYLPSSLKKNIRFLTGLPVPEGETRFLTGFENAVRLNANVVFCPRQYVKELKTYRSFILADMDEPTGEIGAFSKYIVQSGNLSDDLYVTDNKLSESIYKEPYEGLNKIGIDLMIREKQRREENNRRSNQQTQRPKKKNVQKQDSGKGIPNLKSDRQDSRRKMDKSSITPSVEPYSSYSSQNVQKTVSRDRDSYNKRQDAKDEEKVGIGLRILIPFLIIATIAVIVLVIVNLLPQNNVQVPVIIQETVMPTEGSFPLENKDATDPKQEVQPILTPMIPDDSTQSQNSASVTELPAVSENIEQSNMVNLPTNPSKQLESISGTGLHNRYAKTMTVNDPLSIRNEPSKSSGAMASIPLNSIVWAVRTVLNDQDELWTEVYYQGENSLYHGYVSSKYLNLLSQTERNYFNNIQSSPVPMNMYGN